MMSFEDALHIGRCARIKGDSRFFNIIDTTRNLHTMEWFVHLQSPDGRLPLSVTCDEITEIYEGSILSCSPNSIGGNCEDDFCITIDYAILYRPIWSNCAKEMTVGEIEQKLGHKVKIVDKSE